MVVIPLIAKNDRKFEPEVMILTLVLVIFLVKIDWHLRQMVILFVHQLLQQANEIFLNQPCDWLIQT